MYISIQITAKTILSLRAVAAVSFPPLLAELVLPSTEQSSPSQCNCMQYRRSKVSEEQAATLVDIRLGSSNQWIRAEETGATSIKEVSAVIQGRNKKTPSAFDWSHWGSGVRVLHVHGIESIRPEVLRKAQKHRSLSRECPFPVENQEMRF